MKLRIALPGVTAGAMLAVALSLPAAVADPGTSTPGTPSSGVTTPVPDPTDATPVPDPTDSTPVPDPTESDTPADQFEVYGVGNAHSDYWKLALSVLSLSGDQIAGMTAHYRPHGAPTDSPDSGTTTAFGYDPLFGGQISADRPALPVLGVYDVSLDVTDTEGATEHFADVGEFTYAAKVRIGRLTADRSSVDYEHRSYTVSAPVTVTDPSTGAALDSSGVTVSLDNPDLAPGTVATGTVGADGQMTAPVTVKGSASYRTFDAQGTATAGYPYALDSSDSTILSVPAKAETTRIRILSSTDVKLPKGGHTTLRGVLERKVGTVWTPTPGQTVNADGPPYYHASATTDPSGIFTITTGTAGAYYFDNYRNYDPYLDESQTTTPVYVHVPSPSRVTPFHVSEDEYGEAKIDGRLNLNGVEFASGTQSVTIQFSYDNKTWHTVGTTKIGRSGLAGDEFSCYATYGGQANGYWRAYFRGTPDYSPSYSSAVKIYRTPSRITGGTPSHTTVRKNTYLTFGGHVEQRSTSGKWSGISHTYAYLEFRPSGSSTWHYVTRVKTDSKGAYHLRGKATRTGSWAVVWFTSDSHHIDSNGPQRTVHVKK